MAYDLDLSLHDLEAPANLNCPTGSLTDIGYIPAFEQPTDSRFIPHSISFLSYRSIHAKKPSQRELKIQARPSCQIHLPNMGPKDNIRFNYEYRVD